MTKRKVIDPEHGLLRALGHPLRKWLLKLLVEEAEALSPKELAVFTKEPLSDVSYHVRQLAEHGAVNLAKTETKRGAVQHFYRPSELVMGTPWAMEMLLLHPGMLREPTKEERARARKEVELPDVRHEARAEAAVIESLLADRERLAATLPAYPLPTT